MESLHVATWRIPKASVEDVEYAAALAGSEEALARFLRDRFDIAEVVYLATCQRVLIAYTGPKQGPRPEDVFREAVATLRPGAPVPESRAEGFSGFAAYEHLAEVTASLDSLVIGEAQILGQMKAAYQAAEARGHVGKPLRRTFSLVFKAAKRIRSDTALFRGKVSLVPLTVELLEARFNGIQRPEIAVVGTGTIGRRMLDLLRDYPQCHVHLVSRSMDRAREAAAPYGATPQELAAIFEKPPRLDVLVLSARAEQPFFTPDVAERFAAASQGDRPLLVIDLALPRNAHEDVRGVQGIALVQLDELANISERNKAEREREVRAARELLREELEALRVTLTERAQKGVLLDLRADMDAAARERLDHARDLLAPLGVDPDSPAFQRWYQQAVKHFTHVALTHTRRELKERALEEREAP